MRVSDSPAVMNETRDQHLSQASHENVTSPMELALLELQETAGSALSETLQDMGMVLGGRLRDFRPTDTEERQLLRQQALLKMVERMQQQEGGLNAQLTQQENSSSLGQQLLSIAALLVTEALDRKKRKKLSDHLSELMEQEGWEIALFGMLELGHVDKGALAQMNRLFQQAMDEDNVSLSDWFQRVMEWPDRRQRIRVLLRAMAFELSACVIGEQQARLAAVLVRLRRLLLFLGLEKECQHTETACQLSKDTLLPLLIDATNESWLFAEWLEERITPLVDSPHLYQRLLQHLDALFSHMPDRCFNDEDQRDQILTVLRGLKQGG